MGTSSYHFRTAPYQPRIVNLKELTANRAAAQRFDQEWLAQQPLPLAGFEAYHASNLLQCEWSEYGGLDSNTLVPLYWGTRADHREYGGLVTQAATLRRSHLLYRVDHIHEQSAYLSRIALLHTPLDTPLLQGDCNNFTQ